MWNKDACCKKWLGEAANECFYKYSKESYDKQTKDTEP